MPRWLVLALAVLFLPGVRSAFAQDAPWPTLQWPTSSLDAQGLDPGPFAALDAGIRHGEYGNVDRMVVIRNGYLVVNERYERDYREISRGHIGPLGCGWESCEDESADHDYNYLHPATHPYFGGRDVHSLQSVTKAISATVLGVAIENGAIDGMDAQLLSFFGDYDLSGIDPRLYEATLEHLLTMTSGIEWHEIDRPLDDTNTTLQLERSDDWIQFTLDQPMDAAPGEKWVYNSGGSHLMSGVVKAATGQFIDAYAEEHLFGPLGIPEHHWKTTPRGFPDTEGGLYLEALQVAKIGFLYLRDGVWDGERILGRAWLRDAVGRRVELADRGDERNRYAYGYQWDVLDADGVEVWYKGGFGGQLLIMVPEADIVGVINQWNVFERPPQSLFRDFMRTLIEAAPKAE